MPRMKILNSSEKEALETPPLFNVIERSKFFNFPSGIIEFTEDLRTPTNKICFLVMLGYFKATNKFFSKVLRF